MKIVSGGQAGVERAALNVAIELGIPCGGWCPRGRLAEDGPISTRYPLFQTTTADDREQAEWNVRDSDGTLVLTMGRPNGATSVTIDFAVQHRRPCLVIDLLVPVNRQSVRSWLAINKIQTLNVAGPLASQHPEIYELSAVLLREVLVP